MCWVDGRASSWRWTRPTCSFQTSDLWRIWGPSPVLEATSMLVKYHANRYKLALIVHQCHVMFMSGCLDVVKMFSFLQTHVPCTLLKKMQIANRGPDCIIQYSRHSWTEKLMIFIGADVRKKKKKKKLKCSWKFSCLQCSQSFRSWLLHVLCFSVFSVHVYM